MDSAKLKELERVYANGGSSAWDWSGSAVYFGDGGIDLYRAPSGPSRAELIAALHNAAPELFAAARRLEALERAMKEILGDDPCADWVRRRAAFLEKERT